MVRRLVDEYGHTLSVVDSAQELRELARRAGLKIATECRCGKCHVGSGQRGYVDGEAALQQVEGAKSFAELLPPTRQAGLYLVMQLGHFDVADDTMLAGVCSPSLRRGKVFFQVGLHYSAGNGQRDVPLVAHQFAQLCGEG